MHQRFWEQVARLPGLSAVVDYRPQETTWARYIDRLQRRALALLVRPRASDRLLDFGCGVGRITAWLAPRAAEVLGVDPCPAMIDEARRRVRLPNVHFHLQQGDPRELPFRELDGAVAVWVLQHILDEDLLGATLDYLAVALRPGASVWTIDRLCRDRVDDRDSEYLRLRAREDYVAAFAARGMVRQAGFPITVEEQVLGRPSITRFVQRRGAPDVLVAADLAWARRQADPFVADYLFQFRRQ